jgi:hypothetical protein
MRPERSASEDTDLFAAAEQRTTSGGKPVPAPGIEDFSSLKGPRCVQKPLVPEKPTTPGKVPSSGRPPLLLSR